MNPSEYFKAGVYKDLIAGIMLYHGGYFHANNSIVTMDEITEGGLALLCLTDNLDCCILSKERTRFGEWYFPNGTMVDAGDVYTRRSRSVVLLNRGSNATFPSGVYQCEIPDKHGRFQSIYVGIYSIGSGMSYLLLDQHLSN